MARVSSIRLLLLHAFVLLLSLVALLPATARASAGELLARYAELQGELRNNDFGHALHIDSSETPERLTGDVYAMLEHPFATVSDALRDPARWCDILILPFNTKYCHAMESASGPVLQVRIGRRYDQPVERAYRLHFAWTAVAARRDYFETRLQAAEGPVGTHDYRIAVSAIPLENGRTFLRLNYSYAVGLAGRMAMQLYLGTAGADKVGFTVVGRDGQGRPQYIGGVRGAIERNAMRYYLAIDAYLDSLRAPPELQVERRIRLWFAATERYPRQLQEMDANTYVTMKRAEVQRQQTPLE